MALQVGKAVGRWIAPLPFSSRSPFFDFAQITRTFGLMSMRTSAASATTADPQTTPSSPPLPKNTALMQFFPGGTVFEDLEVGRSWRANDLRIKSFEELHKVNTMNA